MCYIGTENTELQSFQVVVLYFDICWTSLECTLFTNSICSSSAGQEAAWLAKVTRYLCHIWSWEWRSYQIIGKCVGLNWYTILFLHNPLLLCFCLLHHAGYKSFWIVHGTPTQSSSSSLLVLPNLENCWVFFFLWSIFVFWVFIYMILDAFNGSVSLCHHHHLA